MSRVKPSYWIFLINKTPNLNYLPFSLVFFVFYVFFVSSISSRVRSYIPLIIVTLILVIGIALLLQWKKFQELNSIFKCGAEVFGEVIEVYFFRGHGYIRYEYEYQQEKYRFMDSIYQNRKTKGVTVGQKVMLYVNPQKSAQAFIRDLYLQTF